MKTLRDFAAERKVIEARLEADLDNRSSDEEVEAITDTFITAMNALYAEEREAHEAGKRPVNTAAEAESLIDWEVAEVDLEALTAGGRNLWDIRSTVRSMVEEANGIVLFGEAYLYFLQNFPARYGNYTVISVNQDDIVLAAGETMLEGETFLTSAILMWMGE